MKAARRWGKPLLGIHLFVCCVWLFFFRSLFYDPSYIPEWVFHVVICSMLAVQFTWGFTVGLLVGPSRKRRDMLWWSLLTVFYPLWFFSHFIRAVGGESLLLAACYTGIFTALLACETFCGVLLGAKAYSSDQEDENK